MNASGKKSQAQSLTPDQEAYIKKILGIRTRMSRSSRHNLRHTLDDLQRQLMQYRDDWTAKGLILEACVRHSNALETVWHKKGLRTVITLTIVNGTLCLIPQVRDIRTEALGREVLSVLKANLKVHGTAA